VSRASAAAAGRDDAGKPLLPVWAAYAMLTLAALFWGGSAVVGRAAAGHVPPFALTFWRWAFAFVVFIPLGGGALWRQREAARRNWKALVALSFLGMGGFSVPYFYGLIYTQAANAAILNALSPMLILIISAFTLGTSIAARQLVGVVLGIGGAGLIVFRGELAELLGLSVNVGDALILVSMVFWAFYTVALRKASVGLDQGAFMLCLTGLAVPMIAPFYAIELASGQGFDLNLFNVGIILYAGVCSSVLAYICWNLGVVRVGPAKAGFAQYLVPVFGALLAVAILGESLRWFHLAGIVAIFAGIAISSRGKV
jgi:drug/metabolite transporter (DMT)-like permease